MTLHSFYYNKKIQEIQTFFDTKYKCLVIDEFSMVDIFIFYKILTLLEKYKMDLKIILVGDPNQLPSIKLGQLLRDLINSEKFPVFTLEKIYRSDKGITTVLTHLLKNKRIGMISNKVEVVNYQNPEDLDLLVKNPYTYFYNSNNVILCPTNVAVNELNQYIQIKNPHEFIYRSEDINLKHDDKVIFLKNNSDYNLYNGTILYIKEIEYNNNVVKIIFKNDKMFECDVSELSNYLKLSYAKTIHKSQGSEYDNVYIFLNRYPKIMWDIKLIYTAISRAKKNCYISGDQSLIQKSCAIERMKISSIPDLLKN